MADTAANSDSRPEGKTPGEWAKFFNKELSGSATNLRKWKRHAHKTVKRYIDDRAEGEDTWFRLNLFHANIVTLMSMLYGQLPKVEVRNGWSPGRPGIAWPFAPPVSLGTSQ